MKCPVCSSSGIPDDVNQCPQCLSDLEAFKMSDQIEKAGKRSSVIAIVSSLLLIVILFACVFYFFYESDDGKSTQVVTESNEVGKLNTDYDKVVVANNSLTKENTELKERLKTLAVEKAKRKKDYVVLQGETLYSISRKIYGNGFKYVDLAKDNNITEPDNLVAGQTLVIYY